MKIKKRDNTLEQLSFDKIIYRLRKLSNDPSIGVLKTIDPDLIAQRVVSSIYDGITSQELDEEAARIAIGMTDNPEYAKLASRIVISNLHKSTIECFSEVMERLYANKDKSGDPAPIIADDIIEIVRKNKNDLNFAINYTRDYMFDYFGFKTLEKSYLMKIWNGNGMVVAERPQHMYMRVAIGIHKNDIKSALETYELISQHFYTHASPTIFNSGTRLSNLSSCFHEDTIVTTVNRGPVKIKDVEIGDLVVTHKGNVKKVLQLHKNLLGDRKLYELDVAKTAPIKVTDNHKLWVLRGQPDTKTYGKRPYAKYDIDFVRDFLQKGNCELISTEYINMKTKLQFKCVCGTVCNASFECIYYNGNRCSSKKCIYERRKLKEKTATPLDAQWISVEELKPGDYIGIPNKQEEVERIKVFDLTQFNLKSDRSNVEYQMNFDDTRVRLKSQWTQPSQFKESHRYHNSFNRFWKIDEDFAKFIGIFYGDGHIIRGKTSYGDIVNRGIGITIHNVNQQLIDFCKEYGERLFGITPTIHAMSTRNITQVLFNSVYIGEIFKELFGVGFNNKKIWSEIYKWEGPLVKALLEGLVTTDGCVTSSSVSIQMSNVNFMRQLYYLLRNNNIDASYGKPHLQKNGTQEHVIITIPVECVDKTAIYKTYTDDRMSDKVSYCRNQYSYRSTDNGFKFLKYNAKTEITQDLPQYVYTLGVEEDHSYNVEGIVAENCFLLGTCDSIEGIYKTITDCGRISKVGGGIGVHVSNIRAKGSLIRGTNGISDGIVPMLKVYNSTCVYINQSGRRKGSFAIYIEPYHADIMEFLDMKKNQGHEDMRARDLFYALWIPDLFMKQVETDGDWYLMCPDECPGLSDVYGKDFENLYNKYVEEKKYKKVVKAQEVWRKVLDSQIETGVPYIGYKDAVNKKCNQKNLGMIKSSNLCVAPETMILTSTGYHKIIDIENKNVEVWNGKEFSMTTIKKTGENQELLTVKLSNGSILECTPYHKFYIVRGKRPSQYPRTIMLEAKQLQKGMKLLKSEFPIIKEGSSDWPFPYEHGLFCADGTVEHNSEYEKQTCGDKSLLNEKYCKRHININGHLRDGTASVTCQARLGEGFPRITLYGEKKKLLPFISTRLEVLEEDKLGRLNCKLPMTLKSKFEVPINCNISVKLQWLEGLLDGDGCVINSDGLTGVQVGSIHYKFLTNVKYLLQTLGCDPKINKITDSGFRKLPDGKGGESEYFCQELYRMCITSHDTAILYDLGLRPKRLQLSGQYPKNNTKRWIKVEDIIVTKRISDTYCFKEEKRGMGIFNGILTGQCLEISLYSNDKEYAVCNLASVALPKYVEYNSDGTPYFNFNKLCKVAEYIIKPMNKVIDNNYYPTEETKKSNCAHRPLGIGVQGLADVYIKMRYPFESKEAKDLNKKIFETLYYGCMKGSIEQAKREGPYSSFKGSPFSEGKFQFDLAAEFDGIKVEDYLSGMWDWESLREDLKKHGSRNSMLVALMPTASTAQIMGNSECFEPIDSCIFKRRVLSGEYLVINKHLVEDLLKLDLWSKEMKEKIIAYDGSIQMISEIPGDLKSIYKTVWETSMKSVIEQASDRGVFVDQMQSMNLFLANPTYKNLTSMHFYAWKNNLKSGMYYLRSKSSASAGKFSVDVNLEKEVREKQKAGGSLTENEQALLCSIDNKDECIMCSS